MQDLTKYSSVELTLQVFNNPDLYSIRHNRVLLYSKIFFMFKYTDSQLQDLVIALADDLNEITNNREVI